MTQRDIAKDKEMCEAAQPLWKLDGKRSVDYFDLETGYWTPLFHGEIDERDARFIAESRQALPYWIAQYEDMKVKYSCAAIDHAMTMTKLEAAQARIRELESATLLHTQPDAKQPQTGAQTLSDAIEKLIQQEGKR